MEEKITIKKRTIYSIIGIFLIGGFLVFAFLNIVSGTDDVGAELVQGGVAGSNEILREGDIQIVNLGVAAYNYDPATIVVEAGKPVKIVGNMDQLQGCLRAFSIPQLGLSKIFKGSDNVLEFTPTEKGRFGFSCSMGMGSGTLVVQ